MKEGREGGEGRNLPAILLAAFFAQSLTLVPRALLPNPTETLATQAKGESRNHLWKFIVLIAH